MKPTIGSRYGRLIITSFAERSKTGMKMCNVVCDCGTHKTVYAQSLQTGKTRSCGCLKKELQQKGIHGMSQKPGVYKTWAGMKERCINKNSAMFHRYGGRGISVCDRWLIFVNFLEDMGQPQKGQSIDRINNDGNYEPGNCKWSTSLEQANNTSRNKFISYDGVAKSMSQWSLSKGWPRNTLRTRLSSGWSVDRAMTEPIKKGVSNETTTAKMVTSVNQLRARS